MSVIKMPIAKKVKYAMRVLDCMEVLTIDGTYDENPDYEDTITYMRFQNIISKKKEQMFDSYFVLFSITTILFFIMLRGNILL